MSYKLTYTGQQVQDYLDKVAAGQAGGGSGDTPTSIDGLAGGTLTSPLKVTGGDGLNASKIVLDNNNEGQITDNATATLLGFTDTTNFIVGHKNYGLKLRGNTNRPQYTTDNVNYKPLALYSDIQSTAKHDSTLLATNVDLNTLQGTDKIGWYHCGGGNSCANKPTGVDAFGLEVGRSAEGYYFQVLTNGNANPSRRYVRTYGSAWTAWQKLAITSEIPTNYVTTDTVQDITGKKTVVTPQEDDNSKQIANTEWVRASLPIKSATLNSATKTLYLTLTDNTVSSNSSVASDEYPYNQVY